MRRLLFFILLVPHVFAIPQLLSLDGYLTNSSGSALNSSLSFNFTLYNASTGGTALWTETQTLAVSSGKLNALLGSVTALNLPFDQDYYLGVKVSADAEMSPRYRIASSAYSYKSKMADNSNYSNRSGFAYASNPYALQIPTVLALSFNEVSGQTARDFSGLSNHGTLGSTAGADANDPTWAAGKIGGALQFDGVNDFVNFSGVPTSGSGDFTFSAWINSANPSQAGPQGIFVQRSLTNGIPILETEFSGTSGKLDFQMRNNSGGYINIPSNTVFSANTWYLVTFVKSGTVLAIYVNGNFDNSGAYPGGSWSSADKFNIGKDLYDNARFFNGIIDEVRVYNLALSAAEIKALYEAGLQ